MRERKRNPKHVIAPMHFVIALKYSGNSMRSRGRACGIGRTMVSRILKGFPVNKERLDMAMANLYGKNDGSIMRSQMRGIVNGSKAAGDTFMRLLRNVARIVEKFEPCMRISVSSRQFYVFPPQDSVLSMVTAIEACSKMLSELHRQCPEYDHLVFRDAKKLLKKMKKEDVEVGET